MQINFSNELRHWIVHNLERGCAAQDLIASMVEQKFEAHIARGIINAFIQARQQGIAPPQHSLYLEEVVSTDSALADDISDYSYETSRLAPGPILFTSDRQIPVLIRHAQPVLALLENVLSADECDQLIALARHRLQPSTVVDPETGQNKIAEHRNSYGMFFSLQENDFIARLDKRISELMNCPVENGEGLQVLHYGPDTKNTPHFDFILPTNHSSRESIARSGQRISTLIIYLNDVESGGETQFPEIGLSVIPKKGNAVYFEYANSLHQLDHKSLHAGAPVNAGEKWIVTKWMREKKFIAAK